MNKKTSEKDNTVIMSDKYISESGVQGGKVIGEHIVLGSFIAGITFLLIGLYAIFSMLLGSFPTNTAIIILVILVNVIGLIMIIGGFLILSFLVVGGIIPLLPEQTLSKIPKWAEWPILICGGIFILIGFFFIEDKNLQ